MIDLNDVPVIDTHCHPFPPDQTEIDAQLLRDAVSVALHDNTPVENETMLLSRMMIKGLAALLGTDPSWEAVLGERNSLARADIKGYHRLLFSDQRIGAVMVDPGFPSSPTIPAEAFAEVVPCPVFEGYRIERFFQEHPLGKQRSGSLADYVEAFKARLDQEAAKPALRYFKTVIAYATGLAIRPVSQAEALSAWETHAAPRDAADKTLRDYFFWLTAEKAAEHGLPFQVHTGHTSQANVWPNVNPILLTPLLNQPELGTTQFVLVHGGYPFCTEAGYMTSVYANVALDLSLMIPWCSIGIARRIEETLESAPTSKVMYGSDGIYVPELYWISAKNARRALGRVLGNLTDDEVLDADEAEEVGRDILYRNALRIYRLDSSAMAYS